MNWLRKLLGLCPHKWNKVEEISVFYTDNGVRMSKNPSFYKYVLQCQHCGNMKVVKV